MINLLKRLSLFRSVLLILLLNLLLSSCGYHLQTRRTLPGDVKKIVIPVFDNHTMEPDIEVPFADALQTEFYRTRYAEVVQSKKDADAIVQGTITSFLVSQVARKALPISGPQSDNISVTREYLVRIDVLVKLIRVSDNKVLWQNQIWDSERYIANPGGVPENTRNEDRQRAAIKEIAETLGEDIHVSLTWGF